MELTQLRWAGAGGVKGSFPWTNTFGFGFTYALAFSNILDGP